MEHFVSDGFTRARAANEPLVRAEVEAEYAERLQSAGWFRQRLLSLKIEREIDRRLERCAPRGALYLVTRS